MLKIINLAERALYVSVRCCFRHYEEEFLARLEESLIGKKC
jgi:hypothetical protein